MQEKYPATSPNLCAVCGIDLRHRTVTTREYLAEVYSFCSEKCAEKFVSAPEEFMEENGEEEEV